MQALNFIDGKLQPTASTLDLVSPGNGSVYGSMPRSGKAEVDQAVAAAKRAFPDWAATPAVERARCLDRLADLVAANASELATAEARDNGKPVSLASHVDIPRAEKNLRFYASGIQHYASQSHAMEGEAINYTLRKPLGVVACISPWNLPLYLFTWKVAPALAAGNCVVAKPSELTPVTAYMLSMWVAEAGFPPGVFNVLHGLGAEVGEALVLHDDIAAVSFTGGTATGARIAGHVAPKFKKMSLNWVARTRPLCSPTPTSRKLCAPPSAVLLRTKDKFACVVLASWSSGPSTRSFATRWLPRPPGCKQGTPWIRPRSLARWFRKTT